MSERERAERAPARVRPRARGEAVPPELAGAGSPSPGRLRLLNVGYGNVVIVARVVAIVAPQSSPMRRLRRDAADRGKLIDATEGRRTRSILVTDSDHVVLSAINPETIAARLLQEEGGEGER